MSETTNERMLRTGSCVCIPSDPCKCDGAALVDCPCYRHLVADVATSVVTLDIPDEAAKHIVGAYGYDESNEDWPRLMAALEAAAPLVVAAELDRLADSIESNGRLFHPHTDW